MAISLLPARGHGLSRCRNILPRVSPTRKVALRYAMERDAALEAVFQPVRPPTTFEETVERLGTAIRLGLLAPGAKLPPERELATELRISRSTLREALTTLTQSGHLIAQRGRGGGTFVAEEPPLSGLRARSSERGGVGGPRAPRRGRDRRRPSSPASGPSPADFDRLDELVERMAEVGGLRGLPPRRHPLPHRAGRDRPFTSGWWPR